MVFFPFTHCVPHFHKVIRKHSIQTGVQPPDHSCRVIRLVQVADKAGCVGFPDLFLIDMPMEELYLLAAVFHSALHDIVRPVSRPAPPKTPETDPEEPGEDPPASARNRNMEDRPRMTPSITLTEHDDSIYQGSMNAVTGEGYDPCHDEQLAPLTAAESAFTAPAETVPGLRLSWNGNEVVRGLVMSEILNRKRR